MGGEGCSWVAFEVRQAAVLSDALEAGFRRERHAPGREPLVRKRCRAVGASGSPVLARRSPSLSQRPAVLAGDLAVLAGDLAVLAGHLAALAGHLAVLSCASSVLSRRLS